MKTCVIVVIVGRLLQHCHQRAPVENVLSASGTSHLGMIDIQATTKSKYYDHIVLLYLKSRRCRHLSIIFVRFYLYVIVVNFIEDTKGVDRSHKSNDKQYNRVQKNDKITKNCRRNTTLKTRFSKTNPNKNPWWSMEG